MVKLGGPSNLPPVLSCFVHLSPRVPPHILFSPSFFIQQGSSSWPDGMPHFWRQSECWTVELWPDRPSLGAQREGVCVLSGEGCEESIRSIPEARLEEVLFVSPWAFQEARDCWKQVGTGVSPPPSRRDCFRISWGLVLFPQRRASTYPPPAPHRSATEWGKEGR